MKKSPNKTDYSGDFSTLGGWNECSIQLYPLSNDNLVTISELKMAWKNV